MLKKIFFSIVIISNFCSEALFGMELEQDANSGFIAKQGSTLIQTLGKCDERHAPFSTFKVVLSLMGFDAGILKSKDSPKWSFKEEYLDNIPWYNIKDDKYGWLGDHTPETFIANSILWFSHQITQHLGAEKFQEYVSRLNYGNQDISGTSGQNDGLLNSWLGTSLQISPREQVEFLERLLANTHNVSKEAHENTRIIMDRKETWNEWKLYGKTGGGKLNNGWFIGWIEKDGAQPLVFAQYLDLDDSNFDLMDISIQKTVGLTAKELAKRHLKGFWQEAGNK